MGNRLSNFWRTVDISILEDAATMLYRICHASQGLQSYGILKKYVGMRMSDSVLKWHITNYALERRLPGLLALKTKLLPSCETSVAICYSPRWDFPPDLNIQRHCHEKLTSRSHITESCNTTEVLPIFASQAKRILTLNIPSLARQRRLSSWGPWRTPWYFCNFSTVWCGRLLKLCFLGFWNYNSVIQALLASNILCLFISMEVSQ